MKTLEKNVINVWGVRGKSWLTQLPNIIAQLSQYWSLKDITPVDNMSYNYVAKARQKDDTQVVLKISCDNQLIEDEYRALKHFNGQASIKALDIRPDLNALLLEQAIPGKLLKCNYLADVENTIKAYAGVVNALASQIKPLGAYPHVKKWCETIDRINDKRIKPYYVSKAKELSTFLLNSVEKEYLCHGDLHLENILHHESSWVCIDPKGIIGEMAFEAAAFDLIDKSEWSESHTIQDKIMTRIKLIASALEIEQARLFAWIFLRVIISAQWFIEDNGSPDEMLNLAFFLYPLLSTHYQLGK